MDTSLSRLTLGAARRRLGEMFFPADPTTPAFAEKVEEVLDRLHSEDYWPGSRCTYSFVVSPRQTIILPLFLNAVIAAQVDGVPRQVMSERYEFVVDGPGPIEEGRGYASMLVDAGESSLELDFPAAPGGLTVRALNPADEAVPVRVRGWEPDAAHEIQTSHVPGIELVHGEESDMAFAAVKGVQKPVTQGSIQIVYGVDTSDEVVLAEIPASVELPVYRRYRTTARVGSRILAYCERRPLPVRREEDYLLPDSLSALKMGLFAVSFEEKSEPKRAEYYWEQARQILTKLSTHHKGGAQDIGGISPWGQGIPAPRNL